MTYLGALVLHANHSDLCLLTSRVAGGRIKLLHWASGVERTAKEEDIVYIPIPDAIERLRTLIVSETPPHAHEHLGGKADLVAAAYAYTSFSTVEPPLIEVDRVFTTAGSFPKCGRTNHSVSSVTHSAKIPNSRVDFIREAVIAEILLSNLAVDASGKIKVWGTKVDLIRLVEIYCETAGVRPPTKSLVLRRFTGIISFFAHKLTEKDLPFVLNNLYPLRELRFDIREMEP